ncbi:MAG: hypothetical protein ACTSUE_16360 [Promethearchaeota archaeon]
MAPGFLYRSTGDVLDVFNRPHNYSRRSLYSSSRNGLMPQVQSDLARGSSLK